MAKASTEKSTKLEPSEIFAAVGLHMTKKEMNDLCEDKTGSTILSFLSRGKVIANDSNKIQYGSSKSTYLTFFTIPNTDKKKADLIANVVAGFSAAIGVKNFVKGAGDFKGGEFISQKVFMTGSAWPREVDKFRLKRESDGFDYNSSDLVVKVDSETYYGISLKKKKNVKGADPTLINKAFDTFLQGNEFEKVRNSLKQQRQDYFAGLAKQAAKDEIIYVPGIDTMSSEQIWNISFRNPLKNNQLVYLINLKGTNTNDRPVELSEVKGKLAGTGPDSLFREDKQNGLRAFFNRELAKVDNELFEGFKKVLNDNIQIFADGLIDIVLKTKMQAGLRAKDIGGFNFEFALVTGYADYTPSAKNPKLNLNAAKVIPQHSILCGLSDLQGNKKPYILELDEQKKLDADAAKVFFNLKKAGVTILVLELRYKGDFKAQPQFFATLGDDFITQMFDKCIVDR
tara:strand:- start:78 stop:1445 length:1368 start_codon:yes stop_codon:yes gene_type:complete